MTEPLVQDNKRYIKIFLGGSGKKPYDSRSGTNALFTFSRAVYGRGLEVTRDLSISPGFLKSWSWDSQEKKYRLTIDPSYKFHHGRTVSAEDVEFMLLKSNLSPINLKARKWLTNIEGLSDLKPGTPFRTGMVPGIKINAPDTLDIRLSEPNPAFLFNLARSVPSLVPPELMDNDLVTYKKGQLPIGSGAYKVIFDDPHSTLVRLERVKKSSRNNPEVVDLVNHGDGLTEDFDVILGPRVNPNAKKYVPIVAKHSDALGRIDFNYSSEAGKRHDFRAAVYYGLNRREIVSGYDIFEPAFEHLSKGFMGRLNTQDPFDPKKAKEHVSRLPEKIQKSEHKVYFYGELKWNPYVHVIERQLRNIGLNVTFVSAHKNQLRLTPEDREIPMWMSGMMADFLDPLNMFSDYLPGANNTEQYPKDDLKMKQLFDDAMRTESLDKKNMALQDLSRHFLDQFISVPVMEQKNVYWVNPKKIAHIEESEGVSEPNIMGIFLK